MTHLEYVQRGGISNTMLGKLERSPAHLQEYLSAPPESTIDQEVGIFFHELLLTMTAPQNIAIRPADERGDFRKAVGKAWRNEQESNGLTVLTQDEYAAIYGMRDSLLQIPTIRAAIESGEKEKPLFSNSGGIAKKGRLDLLTAGAAIVDFKSCANASLDAFAKSIANYGYARQAAYYLDLAKDNGLPHTEFVFVAIEKEKPYAVGVYQLDQESIRWGRNKYKELLRLYMECKQKNDWPGYGNEPQIISLPQWAMRERIEDPAWLKEAV